MLWLGAPLCPSAGWLGIPCPGCGLTRATIALLRGDVAEALRFHPLVFVALPILAGLAVSSLWGWLRGEPAGGRTAISPGGFGSRLRTGAAAILVVALLVVWGLRFFGFLGGPAPVTTYAEWWTNGESAFKR